MDQQTILIIEDNPANMELAKDLIEASGYSVLTAFEADVGMRLAREAHPDLILMDWGLPGMDGLAATRRLKNDPATRDIPIVILTAHAMKGDQRTALTAGCDGYLTKPIATRTFVESLDAWLKDADQFPAPPSLQPFNQNTEIHHEPETQSKPSASRSCAHSR